MEHRTRLAPLQGEGDKAIRSAISWQVPILSSMAIRRSSRVVHRCREYDLLFTQTRIRPAFGVQSGGGGTPALDYLLCASADDVACLWLVNRGNDEARKIRSLRCAHVARQRGSMAGLGGRGTCRQCVPRESLWRPHSP